jgi:serine/threonine-protein phosphatase 2A activator
MGYGDWTTTASFRKPASGASSDLGLSFSYLFGSAQLLGKSMFSSSADVKDSETSPKQALDTALSPRTTPDSISDFYTLSLHRITMFKKGAAFSEHSPMLHSLARMPNWNKPHSGLRKMFIGEVVGKRVVVQGLWIGGWCWGPDLPKVQARSGPSGGEAGQVVTKAPWAR